MKKKKQKNCKECKTLHIDKGWVGHREHGCKCKCHGKPIKKKVKIPTITELILSNSFKRGETFWTSDLRKILGGRPESVGGKISAMSRRGFTKPLFREGTDICWNLTKHKGANE